VPCCAEAAAGREQQNRESERTHQIGVPSRCVSVTCPATRSLLSRPYRQTPLHVAPIPPTAAGQLGLLLPSDYLHLPASAVASKLAHTCSNNYRAALTVCKFHPQSSRIVTANKNGEMALWDLTNGFKFVKQWSAHHGTRIMALEWAHHEQLCVTADSNGVIKCASAPGSPLSLYAAEARAGKCQRSRLCQLAYELTRCSSSLTMHSGVQVLEADI
jgi:WD40 repeat protein